MRGNIPALPQYIFMAWCLVKHRDNFTYYHTEYNKRLFEVIFAYTSQVRNVSVVEGMWQKLLKSWLVSNDTEFLASFMKIGEMRQKFSLR